MARSLLPVRPGTGHRTVRALAPPWCQELSELCGAHGGDQQLGGPGRRAGRPGRATWALARGLQTGTESWGILGHRFVRV